MARPALLQMMATALVGAAFLVGGCSSPPENLGSFEVQPGTYAQAIDASREVLTECGFELDRVDAAGGVVTTRPKRTAGVATLWDGEQSTARQEWEDFINRQEREVRVVFEPADGADVSLGDLRDAEAAGVGLIGRVEAVISRQHRAHRRLQTEAVWLSHYAGDPLMERRHGTRYTVARERDSLLERRLAAQIGEAIGGSEVAEVGP